VELLQLPTPDETHDNIVAYWVPQQLPAPGTPLESAYELSWQGDAQQRPPGSWATQSRSGLGYSGWTRPTLSQPGAVRHRLPGPGAGRAAADAALKAVVTAAPTAACIEQPSPTATPPPPTTPRAGA
jgi:glucans biosynthesis protein